MADIQVKPLPNGPYLVSGPFELLDANGQPVKLDRETVALCRCGGSSNKPFCDGTHRTNGFQG
ncbi:MAG: CDGSH iron-sulfur domain-containing protein [Chloroflexi bacterium]|nr:CDGSH iron-sulfur domain-containing protein [Chloroflexota bacterium]